LALPHADVDIALLNVPCKPATAMKLLADRMLEDNEISWLEIIASAKVPVAKIRSQSCGLRADVVVNQPDGIKTSQFIRDRCKEYPQMKQLLIFLKYFLQQRGLHETYTGGMGSYLLCNVVLHFLQRHPARKDKQLYAATSLGHLLFDFFRYYGKEFRYETQGRRVASRSVWSHHWIHLST
jgi:non-canonical poly(A) RNA polymerase PAPD5/7